MTFDNLAPRVFWAWNDTIKEDEALSQLQGFKKSGIAGVFIHARAGLDIEYMGKEWFRLFGACVEYCEKIGLEVWIYDEYGWPSGFGGGKVYKHNDEFKERYLTGEYAFYDELTAEKKSKLYKAYDFKNGMFVETEDFSNGGHYFVFINTNDYYIDVSNKDAIKYFIEVTHEEYKSRFKNYFGKTIKGVFTDEPHLSPCGMPYGKYIKERFEKDTDYKFDDAVPYILFEKGDCEKYKNSFWKIVNALFAENYVIQYNEWCKKNNLIMTGHFACEEGLVDQIPVCGGVMPFYAETAMPGIDSLGNRFIPAVAYKQVQSVARQTGKREILCETYAGTGYECSFEDMLRIWAYQASFGVNFPCLSISMYSVTGNRKRDYPQYFSYQMPWWNKANTLFGNIKYINERLACGETECSVLVIHPKNYCRKLKGYSGDEKLKKVSARFRLLTENLIDLQTDFDYGDEDLMEKLSSVENGILKIGLCKYKTVIIPDIETTDFTSNLLQKFVNHGGRVISLNENISLNGKSIFAVNRRDYLRKLFTAENVFEKEIFLSKNTYGVCSDLVVTKRYFDDKTEIFVLNKSADREVKATLKTVGRNLVTAETTKGCVKILPSCFSEHDGCTYTDFSADAGRYAILTVKKGESSLIRENTMKETRIDGFFSNLKYTNAMTIDKVAFSLNGKDFSAEDFAIKQNDELYRLINGSESASCVVLRYRFNLKEIPEKLFLACETLGGIVYVNGKKPKETGYFVDKNITKYDIAECVSTGENKIIIEKVIPPFCNPLLGKDVFQSITNVITYPYCIENVYLTGDFSVESEEFGYGNNCYFSKGDFYLTKKREIKGLDKLTAKGLPFYSGTAECEALVDLSPVQGRNYYIFAEKINAECAEITVNDKTFDLIFANERIDVTNELKNGENVIKIKLYSGLRNLFGPHHHKYGKHYYVGPSVFGGIKEWQDEVVYPELKGSTWTDDYSFVEFGLSGIYIEEKETE